MRLLVHIDQEIPPHELCRDLCAWTHIAASMGMETLVTDRRDGRPDLSGEWFRIRYGAGVQRLPQNYDLFIPRRSIRDAARMVRVERIRLVCDEEAPQRLFFDKNMGFDAVHAVFHLLSGREEYRSDNRDELGRHDEISSFLHRNGVEKLPLVDLYVRLLRERIAERTGVPPVRVKWPGGKKFALVLSHDVDTVNASSPGAVRNCLVRALNEKSLTGKIVLSAGALRRALALSVGLALPASARLGRLNRSLEAVCRLEERYGATSTFFVLSPQIRPVHPLDCPYSYREKVVLGRKRVNLSEALRAIEGRGWEIGLHGSINSHADVAVLGEQKQALERILGSSVKGVRQHYLCFENDRTWIAQEAAGFGYDSTHGYNRLAGFRGACSFPFRPFSLSQDRQLGLWEVPLALQDCAIDNSREPEEAYREATRLLSLVEFFGGAAAVSWHLDRFSDPRFTSLATVYERILQWARGRDAFIGGAGEVVEAWKARIGRFEVDLDFEKNQLMEARG